METDSTPEPREDEGRVSTRPSRSSERRPPAPRPAHPRKSDPGTVDLGRTEPAAPTGDAPAEDAPTSDAPRGDAPTTGAPTTGAPTTGAPTTGAPTAAAEPDVADTLVGIPTGPTDPRPTIGIGVAAPAMPTNIYRARRPAVAILLVVPAVVAGLLLVRALAISAFGSPFQTDGVIASSLALASLPLLVSGLYGLVTGAAHGAEQWGFRVWARPPLAYLIVGIAFVIAAGLAIN